MRVWRETVRPLPGWSGVTGPPTGRRSFLRSAILFEGGLVLLALALGWLLGETAFGTVEVGWRPLLWGALATLPPLIALRWLLRTENVHLAGLVRTVEELIGPLFAGASSGTLLLLSLVAGIGEESLFRGVLQSALAGPLGPWPALLLVSALFGLVHFVTATYAVLAGLIGLYLGWLFLRTGNLLVPIVVHAIYDFVALSLLVQRTNAESSTADIDVPAPGGTLGPTGDPPPDLL
ncbi:MAG: CPBP family intramembrane metalloprotease [Gemmatimonadales bacterium]|nr:CPBP family intramembrane metalloprotease [Gemmatimonadales bacterium]